MLNSTFAPNPWDLGTPQSWAIVEDGGARWCCSRGGPAMLSSIIDPIQSGTVTMQIDNPEGDELAIGIDGVTVYDGVPATGSFLVAFNLPTTAYSVHIRDVGGSGMLRISDIHIS